MKMAPSLIKLIFAAFLLLQVWALQSAARSYNGASMVERHQRWMTKFGRSYKDAAEKSQRLEIFKKNVEFIDSFNEAGNRSYKLAVNSHADFTHEEFLSTRTGFKVESAGSHHNSSSSFTYADVDEVPAAVDWRDKGAVTDVKNQASCGCCWAFAAVGAIEGLNQLTTGELVSLSEQELVDCETSSSYGCSGGNFDAAFEFVIQNEGLSRESDYPYEAAQGSCNLDRDSSRAGRITGFEKVPANSESALMKAVANQPVSVAIDSHGYDFRFYSGGVITGDCGTNLNHAVTAVGYGESSDGVKYWLVKNSWGSSWGEGGFGKIQRDSDTEGGLCGIAMRASYPTAN